MRDVSGGASKRRGGSGASEKLTVHQQQEALARRTAGEALVDIARFLCGKSLALNSSHVSHNDNGQPQANLATSRASPHHIGKGDHIMAELRALSAGL